MLLYCVFSLKGRVPYRIFIFGTFWKQIRKIEKIIRRYTYTYTHTRTHIRIYTSTRPTVYFLRSLCLCITELYINIYIWYTRVYVYTGCWGKMVQEYSIDCMCHFVNEVFQSCNNKLLFVFDIRCCYLCTITYYYLLFHVRYFFLQNAGCNKVTKYFYVFLYNSSFFHPLFWRSSDKNVILISYFDLLVLSLRWIYQLC